MKCFIAFFVVLLVGVAVSYEQCPYICTLEYNPICASNGVTERQFSNPCDLSVTNCDNRNNNEPEYVPLARQFCNEATKPKWWP